MKDYYQILQIDRQASSGAIKSAYRKLAIIYHPDINNEPDATERFQEINEAYRVLGNKNRRLSYDLSMAAPYAPIYNEPTPTHKQPTRRRKPPTSRSNAYGPQAYEEVAKPYLKYFQYVCKALFIFCVFLFADNYLPHRVAAGTVESYEKALNVTTRRTHKLLIIKLASNSLRFLLPNERYNYFHKGDAVIIQRTLITNTNFYIAKQAQPQLLIREYGGFYGPKVFMALLLTFCSLIGGFVHPTPNGIISFGVVSTFLFLIVYVLL